MQTAYVTFENGQTWPVKDNYVDAIVEVPLSDVIDTDHEGFLDRIAVEAVGSELLMDIAYAVQGARGPDTLLLRVSGDVSEIVRDLDDIGTTRATIDSFFRTLAGRLGWRDSELTHAKASADASYGDECVIPLATGRELRCPAFPAPCDYVRVVEAGHELMHWSMDEWRESPAEVMGAILGLANGAGPFDALSANKQETTVPP